MIDEKKLVINKTLYEERIKDNIPDFIHQNTIDTLQVSQNVSHNISGFSDIQSQNLREPAGAGFIPWYRTPRSEAQAPAALYSLRKLNIPLIACINLYERPDRYASCLNEFEKLDILDKVYFYRTHKNKNGRIGCYKSHLDLYKMALNKNLEYILIFEDDFKVGDNYEKNRDTIYANLKKVINDDISNLPWSRISLMDTLHISDYTLVYPKQKNTSRHIFPNIKSGGIYYANFTNAKCYFIRNYAMKLMLEKGITENHIDMELFHTLKNTVQIRVMPPLVTDGLFTSDIDWTIDKFQDKECDRGKYYSGVTIQRDIAAESKLCKEQPIYLSITNIIVKKISGFFENSKENNVAHKIEYFTDRFYIFLAFYFETTKLIKLVVKIFELFYNA